MRAGQVAVLMRHRRTPFLIGDLEEALRFINHASRILSDPVRRTRYDQELALTAEGTTEQRIAHFVSNVATEAVKAFIAEKC